MHQSPVKSGVTLDNVRLWGVIAARHGPAVGAASGIAYTVNVTTPQGMVTIGPVAPSHRRPSSFFEIEAAEVGDVCDVIFTGGRMYFLISEGLAGQEGCP